MHKLTVSIVSKQLQNIASVSGSHFGREETNKTTATRAFVRNWSCFARTTYT
jgi:hypothetical protein